MKKLNGIYVIGDVHGDWTALNAFINKKSPKVIIIAGDVAYFWKHDPRHNQGKIKHNGTKIYWIPGNHENMDIVKSSKYPPGHIYEIEKNIFMCSFGSVLNIGGHNILMCGGADSIDKKWRIIGKDWWANETIQNDEFNSLPDPNKVKIDIVVSHTKPSSFQMKGIDDYRIDKYNDPSCAALEEVRKIFNPKMWFFGHFHQADKGKIDECEWFALNCLGDTYGWRKLDNIWLNEENEIEYVRVRELKQKAYKDEEERRKNPEYVHLSEWPNEIEYLGVKSEEDLDF